MKYVGPKLLCLAILLASPAAQAQQKDRNTLVRDDRSRILDDGFWIYNDVDKGLAAAQSSGKPLLVIFRCIPCEACAQLDEQVVEKNPSVRKWLSKFVCVRVVHANGMDLTRFQFDYDQSWAAFFLNGDGTIYGRYGTRSHQHESSDDVSLDGFLDTMSAALELHQNYPKNKPALEAKTGPIVPVRVPEEFPDLKERYTSDLNYSGEVARSCIHCHQVGDAWHAWYRAADEPIPAKILYPYPHPKILGLIMDPATATSVKDVLPNSWAAKAGFQAGDRVRSFAGQPVISTADMQWVLQHADSEARLTVVVDRQGTNHELTLELPDGWRESGDISWRVSSWPLRGKVFGGMRLVELTTEEQQALGQSAGIGLKVARVGQFGPHAAAKRAGVKQDDILVAVNGRKEPMSESQLLVHLLRTTQVGDEIEVELLRDGKLRQAVIPIQQ